MITDGVRADSLDIAGRTHAVDRRCDVENGLGIKCVNTRKKRDAHHIMMKECENENHQVQDIFAIVVGIYRISDVFVFRRFEY